MMDYDKIVNYSCKILVLLSLFIHGILRYN